MNKEGSYKPLIFVMILSLFIAAFWDSFPVLKNSVHFLLDPTAGILLNLNPTIGLSIIVFIISLFTVIIQKYATDQETLKELRKEQKIIQEEMKKYKDHPEKLMELQKKQFEFLPRTMKLTMRPIIYTGIPFILFFRWFNDFFATMQDVKFFGITGSWFITYLVLSILFTSILKKVLKVV
jgi:uncharacterized membrane protein (DUF106 family)